MSPPGFAETLLKTPPSDRIRVAILDTGVDPTDKMIKATLRSRIQDRRAFVGSSPIDHGDIYGHGTHVARLLLKMAPAAEIFIAKVCEGKHLDADRLSSIAKAIDYAVTEWNVDIISMSFGYYDKNDEIDAAVDRALKADKLLFAAASNEGGNRGRSRLGRHMCACVRREGEQGGHEPEPAEEGAQLLRARCRRRVQVEGADGVQVGHVLRDARGSRDRGERSRVCRLSGPSLARQHEAAEEVRGHGRRPGRYVHRERRL